MSTLYVDKALLKSNLNLRRDQIFNTLCKQGWDMGAAMIEARHQAEWEFRDWHCFDDTAQCESEKDVTEYGEEMSLGGRTYREPR